jgi:hypothetical protein
MPELSIKQKEFRDRLLLRLGFINGEIMESYKDSLFAFSQRTRRTKDFTYVNNKTEEEVTIEVPFNVLDFLLEEFKLKQNRKWQLKLEKGTAISATDLANFTFCPASYSIANTFEVENTLEMEIGTEQHERQWLLLSHDDISNNIKTFKEHGFYVQDVCYVDEENLQFFEDIRNSKVLYSGHKNNSQKVFFSKNKKFVGQPDYVFQTKEGVSFIVEEKFQHSKEAINYFKNHKVQLASYLYGLEEFNAQYGYLVYWQYSWENHRQVVKCKVYKIQILYRTHFYSNKL